MVLTGGVEGRPQTLQSWRQTLRLRFDAGDEYDQLTLKQRELFNVLARQFIGSGEELLRCVRAIIPSAESATPLTPQSYSE